MTGEDDLPALLAGIRTIAIVGLSATPSRPSNEVARYLVSRGFDCVGVNPGLAGQIVAGLQVVASLAAVEHAIDMVDIFRASEAVGGVVDEALALVPKPKVVWMQLGVADDDAKARAEAAGLRVVVNNCPKIVLSRR